MKVVLDTCSLLWLTLDPSQLSQRAHRALAASEIILVSAISVWEIGIKATRKKLDLGTNFIDFVERLSGATDIEVVPVDHNLFAKSVLLDWAHRDPADRIIVSLAIMHKAKLLTDDLTIKDYYRDTIN